MATPSPATPSTARSSKDQFLDVYQDEHERTMRVLRAYPKDKAELRPHPKSRTARELVWTFVLEQGAMQTVMTTGFDSSTPPQFPPAPDSFDAVVRAFEEGYNKTVELVRAQRDEEFNRPVRFFTGPGKLADLPLQHVLWFMLHDQIHHRGQMTVYLRMADGKVPSVYGPSLDEPWM